MLGREKAKHPLAAKRATIYLLDLSRASVFNVIPNIIIRKTKSLGHYGRLRKAYLEMHRPILFNELVLSDKLFEHCAEIDEAARNRMELIVRSLAEQNGVTEQPRHSRQIIFSGRL